MLYWAKTDSQGRIPTKRAEDAGYDIYALTDKDIVIPPHKTVMIPTGIAAAFPAGYVMLLKERGSTGSRGLGQRAGVIDSGYRGEIIAVITNTTDKQIIYPHNKAITQALLIPLAELDAQEVSYDTLKGMESQRGTGKLGSSGK